MAESEAKTQEKPSQVVPTSDVEVPYLDYKREHGEPYTVSHFELGKNWRDPIGGFPNEVSAIEDYFNDKISNGEMANSISAVKNRLKEMLKVTNMSKEERNLVKVETIAAYIKFLRETDDIKKNVKRYSGN